MEQKAQPRCDTLLCNVTEDFTEYILLKDWETFLLLDGSLTSCIAAMFFFNGLIDVGVILEKSMLTVFLIALSFTGIFLAYFNPFHWNIFL